MDSNKTELTSNTKFTLDLPTLIMFAGMIGTLVTGFITLKTDIQEASDLADRSLTKIEFTISQEAIKQIVIQTQHHIRDGHTTMYHQLIKEQAAVIDEATDKVIEEMRRTK